MHLWSLTTGKKDLVRFQPLSTWLNINPFCFCISFFLRRVQLQCTFTYISFIHSDMSPLFFGLLAVHWYNLCGTSSMLVVYNYVRVYGIIIFILGFSVDIILWCITNTGLVSMSITCLVTCPAFVLSPESLTGLKTSTN